MGKDIFECQTLGWLTLYCRDTGERKLGGQLNFFGGLDKRQKVSERRTVAGARAGNEVMTGGGDCICIGKNVS